MASEQAYILPDSGKLIEVIHSFIRSTARAEDEQEIYWAIVKNFMQTLHVEDCVVYQAIPEQEIIIQRAAIGFKNPEGKMITNLMSLKYGEGIAGWVALHQKTECLDQVSQDPRYILDVEPAQSELCVPIICDGELYGVINSESTLPAHFSDWHVQVFELIADISGGLIRRMRQKEELRQLNAEIEDLLKHKKQALDQAIETVSDQVSELKHQREKREILLREVHHRVNNNLQIISSIVNLYLRESDKINAQTLQEIRQRIQILSSIHLILLKSVENNKHSIQDFLLDLVAAIRYMHADNYLVIHPKTNVSVLSLNTLVPFGLLIYNLIDQFINCCVPKGKALELNLTVTVNTKGGFYLHLETISKAEISAPKESCVTHALVEALVEQLDGKILPIEHVNGIWAIQLYELE